MIEQAQVAAIFRTTLVLSGVAVAASAFWWDLEIFLGMLLGGGLAAANFWVLRRIVDSGSKASTKRQGLLTALFFAKFAALIGVVYVAVVYAPINMAAFLIGISVAFAALIIESLRTLIGKALEAVGMPHDQSWFSFLPGFLDAQKWLQGKLGLSFLAKEHPTLEYIAAALFVSLVSLILVLWARRKWKNTEAALVPEAKFSASNFFEILSQSTLGVMRDVVGDKAKEFLPLIGALAVFIFFSNVMGLIPGFLPPTTNMNATAACAIVVFLWYHGYGIRENWRHLVHKAEHGHGHDHGHGGHGHSHGASAGQKIIVFPLIALWQYFSHFANPVGAWWGWILAPLMLPIELISHLARPMSLSLRLLGNMTGDHAVLGVFLGLVPLLVPLPFLVLGLIVSIIQTLVFCLLSTVYISMAVTHEEH